MQGDIRDAVPEDLVDISMKKSVPARVEEYVQKVGSPFLVRVGDY